MKERKKERGGKKKRILPISLNSAGQGEAGSRARSSPGRRRSHEPPGAPSVRGRAPSGRARRCQWGRARSAQVEGRAAASPPHPEPPVGLRAPALRPRSRQLEPWRGRRPTGQRWRRRRQQRRPRRLLRAGCAPHAAARPRAPAPLGVGQSWGPGAAGAGALGTADPPAGRRLCLGARTPAALPPSAPRPGRPCPAASPKSRRGPRPGRLHPPGGR